MFFEFALIGCTASGKSELAWTLASKHNALILSLDSLCVYKQINIASAKPKDRGEGYFGLDLLSVDEPFNVALFFKEYERAKAEALRLHKPLIITGGTSFYLKALMSGLSKKVPQSKSELSNEAIFALMQSVDKEAKIAKNDSFRLKKWLSIYEYSKQAPSLFLRQNLQAAPIKELEIFELVVDKELLRARIKQRSKAMLKEGLIEEARGLFKDFDEGLKPLNSIGLKECKAYLKGEIDKSKLESLINTHTAQLAKRQRTFNKQFSSTKLQNDEALTHLSEFMQRKAKP